MTALSPERKYHNTAQNTSEHAMQSKQSDTQPATDREDLIEESKEHVFKSINTLEQDKKRLQKAMKGGDMATIDEMIDSETIERQRSEKTGQAVTRDDDEIMKLARKELRGVNKELQSLLKRPEYQIQEIRDAVRTYGDLKKKKYSTKARKELALFLERFDIFITKPDAKTQIQAAIEGLEDEIVKRTGHEVVAPTQELSQEEETFVAGGGKQAHQKKTAPENKNQH